VIDVVTFWHKFMDRLSKSGVDRNVTLECGLMPNVMAALPNIGGALCSTPQSLLVAHWWSKVQ